MSGNGAKGLATSEFLWRSDWIWCAFTDSERRSRDSPHEAEHVVQDAGGRDGGAGARARDDERVRLVTRRREGDLVVGALEAEEGARRAHDLEADGDLALRDGGDVAEHPALGLGGRGAPAPVGVHR